MDEVSKKLLEERLLFNLSTITLCEAEAATIREALEGAKWPIAKTLEDRVKLCYRVVEKILSVYYERLRVDIPKAKDCKLYLWDNRIGFSRKFEWELILPGEEVGGLHYKFLTLTGITSIFPPEKVKEDAELEFFIAKLIEDGFLTHYIKTSVNPLGMISL